MLTSRVAQLRIIKTLFKGEKKRVQLRFVHRLRIIIKSASSSVLFQSEEISINFLTSSLLQEQQCNSYISAAVFNLRI